MDTSGMHCSCMYAINSEAKMGRRVKLIIIINVGHKINGGQEIGSN